MKFTFTLPFLLFGFFNAYSQPSGDNAEIRFNMGNAKHKDGKYIEAIEDYTKAIEMDSTFTRAYFNRGSSKVSVEDYNGALEDYTKAIETDSTYLKAYYNRGFLKNKMKLYAEAIQDYDRVLQIDPTYIIAYYNRGLSYFYNKEMDLACADWKKSLELGYSKAQERIEMYCK